MARTSDNRNTGASRDSRKVPRKPSERQRGANENSADAASKTAGNKKRAADAAARKQKRASNDAQAAALRDTTNGQTAPLSAEAQIAALTAQVAKLDRKNKKLESLHRARARNAASVNENIVPIPKPRGKFNIQSAMKLDGNRNLFTELQAGIHALAHEAKINFKLPWSQQNLDTVSKIVRVAAKRHEYLSSDRFPRGWATLSMLQRYINSVRAYKSGKANPTSGVNRRRERVTNIAQVERRRNRRVMSPPTEDEDPNDNQMDVDAQGTDSPNENHVLRDTHASLSSDESDEENQPDIVRGQSAESDDDDDDDEDDLPLASD
ncbi:hypothetical protein DFH06DRAFT_1345152 [Mycena polygramma]|nr:hypothetical protein DFH06DRAFT_1345152 [Mycena polygramma]